VIGIFLI